MQIILEQIFESSLGVGCHGLLLSWSVFGVLGLVNVSREQPFSHQEPERAQQEKTLSYFSFFFFSPSILSFHIPVPHNQRQQQPGPELGSVFTAQVFSCGSMAGEKQDNFCQIQ